MPINLGDNEIKDAGIARVGTKDARRLHRHALREGDIVFSRRGDVGRRSIVRADNTGWLCGTGCLAARFGSKQDAVNPAYVAHYLASTAAQRWLQDNAVGGTMPNLNTAILAALPVRMPSRAEQDQIVKALDHAHGSIAKIERMIVKKQAIKQGMMQQLLTGRTRLPGHTNKWGEVAIADVALVDPEALVSSSNPVMVIDYISLEDVSRGELLRTSQIEFRRAPLRARRVVKEHDILFGTVRPNLQSHMLYRGGLKNPIASTGFAVIRAGVKADPRFLFYLLMSDLTSTQVDRIIAGSNYPAISSGDVRKLMFVIPNVEEQRAIGAALLEADLELSVLRARLSKARDIKFGMMQQLLTGRTRLSVEIVS